ncbi:IclR family transcriptional regulator [Tomitella gaofuii]|uniref:IclR family transcriptional regulator n=1 Tax=Tomitella gaofuii TaxID=2760083 RepID=UPI0015FE7AEF|nr:helix-turn-helix domain-containing protein [Tomitella gaofuii]
MVDRVASIMECVARSKDGLTLTEVANALGAPVSTTQGLMNGLVATGYLDERHRVYTLGIAPYMLNVLAGRPPVGAVLHEQLQEVHAETGLTIMLSVAVGDELIYVDHVSSEPRYAYYAEQHLHRSLLRTSAGWLFLADREQRDIWAYLSAAPDDCAGYVDDFLERLTELRDTAVCISPAVGAEDDADGVSVALRENGRTVAVLGVIGLDAVVADRRDELLEVCLRHASSWGMR